MELLIKWVGENGVVIDIVNTLIALLSLVITSVLTVLIIRQTTELNRIQSLAEQEINAQQIQMQERQLRVDTYPYKRELYTNLFHVFTMCQGLTQTLKAERLLSMDCGKVFKYYEIIQEKSVPDTFATNWSLREAQFIMAPNVSSSIQEIRAKFDAMCAHFQVLNTLPKVLDLEHFSGEIESAKRHNITQGLQLCNEILAYSGYIESIMPDFMSIGRVER